MCSSRKHECILWDILMRTVWNRLFICKTVAMVKMWKLLQFEQLKGFSPVWILSCISNVADSLKVLSHIEQLKGFLCMWILSWIFKVPALANFLSHFEYLKGFSTVWILSCTFNIADSLKESLKYLPVWISYHTLNSKIVSVFPQNWCGHGSLCSILAVKQ